MLSKMVRKPITQTYDCKTAVCGVWIWKNGHGIKRIFTQRRTTGPQMEGGDVKASLCYTVRPSQKRKEEKTKGGRGGRKAGSSTINEGRARVYFSLFL